VYYCFLSSLDKLNLVLFFFVNREELRKLKVISVSNFVNINVCCLIAGMWYELEWCFMQGIGEKRATSILELREDCPEPFKNVSIFGKAFYMVLLSFYFICNLVNDCQESLLVNSLMIWKTSDSQPSRFSL